MLAFKIFGNDEDLVNVTITAQAPDGPLTVSIPIDINCYLTSGKLIHQMAARKLIQDLEENSDYMSDEINEEISDIALKHSIASKYTSFVGVDKKTRKSFLELAMISCQIHQEVPFGYGSYGSYDSFGPVSSGPKCKGAMPGLSLISLLACCCCCPCLLCYGLWGMLSSMASKVTSMFSASTTTSKPVSKENPPVPPAPLAALPPLDRTPGPPLSSGPPDSVHSTLWDTPALTDGNSTSPQQKEASKDESLTSLIHLQLADGSFKFGKILENLIGMTEQELMEKCYKGEDGIIWITAIAFAVLEKFFPNDKDLWDLVANKAKLFIQNHAKNNFDDVIKNAKTLV